MSNPDTNASSMIVFEDLLSILIRAFWKSSILALEQGSHIKAELVNSYEFFSKQRHRDTD